MTLTSQADGATVPDLASSQGRRLRVLTGLGLPRRQTAYGHGRVWVEILRRLAKRVDLERIEPRYAPVRLRSPRHPDVWLINGHVDPPPVDGPAVVILHEVSWHNPELREQLRPDWAEAHERSAGASVRIATRIITPSAAATREVISAYSFPPDRISTIPYGVDVARFRPDRAGGRALVARASGRPEAPYVLYVGSLLPRKNLPSLREAMASLAAEGFPHRLVIVAGGSPDRADVSSLERAANADLPGHLGRMVRFMAPISERRLAILMAGADAFCLPSLYEGFGLVALEAMACGAPTVVSSGGSLPEVVGDAGIVVDPRPAAIAAGLRRILSDPALARRLRTLGRARAETMTWDHTVDAWTQTLARTAAEGSVSRA
jgi:alpha-1,3-rhamnosyl/mannosyltransferase